jgi:anti-sigma regulatory factor (Ser/Thr protein kinase)
MRPASVTVPASAEFVRIASQFIVQTARQLGVDAAGTPLFEVAIVEALANAVKHGSRGREDAVVVGEIERTAGALYIRIYDEGPGFVPAARAAVVDSSEDIASLPESGYGVGIMQSVFETVRARKAGALFCLELVLPFTSVS